MEILSLFKIVLFFEKAGKPKFPVLASHYGVAPRGTRPMPQPLHDPTSLQVRTKVLYRRICSGIAKTLFELFIFFISLIINIVNQLTIKL